MVYAHKLTLDALLKKPVALKVLVWSRGRFATLQILTSSSLSLVEETEGSSGQCVSFFLIGVGIGFTAYMVIKVSLPTKLLNVFKPRPEESCLSHYGKSKAVQELVAYAVKKEGAS